MTQDNNADSTLEHFELRGVSATDYQALEAERDELAAKLKRYEEAVSSVIDDKVVEQASVHVRYLYTGIQDSLIHRDAATLLNLMLEQVARSRVKLIERDKLINDLVQAFEDCCETGGMPEDLAARITEAMKNTEAPVQTPSRNSLESILLGLPQALKALSGCENTAGVSACIEYIEAEIEECRSKG